MPAADEIALFAERLGAIGADYMITGATAAILYGQPRLTNDIDVVVALRDFHVPTLIAAFPEAEFYAPPEYVIVRKLEYYREGASTKHPVDIRAILATTTVELDVVENWVQRLGLEKQWDEVRGFDA